jgi:hypothetical protein
MAWPELDFVVGLPLADRIDLGGTFTDGGWTLPPDLTLEAWAEAGATLGRIDRAVQWWISRKIP